MTDYHLSLPDMIFSMIRLTAASIKNYKGIEDAVLAFHNSTFGPTVHPLIGLNEAGKSTILEALTFNSSTSENLAPLGLYGNRRSSKFDLIPVSKRTNFSDTISVRLDFILEDSDIEEIKAEFERTSSYRLKHLPKKIALERSIKYIESEEVSNSSTLTAPNDKYEKTKAKQAKPDDKALWPHLRAAILGKLPVLLHVPNFLFDFPSEILLTSGGSDLDSRQKFFHKLLNGVLKAADPKLDFEEHIVKRAESASPEMRRAFTATLAKLEFALQQEVLDQWGKVFGGTLSSHRLRLSEATSGDVPAIRISVTQDGAEYLISDRSLGFRWFFGFLLLMHFSKSLGPNRQAVYLLDEPASNLHSSAQSRLRDCLAGMENTLVLYATHSHFLLSPDLLPTTFVVRNAGYSQESDITYVAAKTRIEVTPFRQFVSKHPAQREHFRVALDALDIPISELDLDFPCLFVEGKNDWYCLRLAVLCGALSLKVPAYPMGGTRSMEIVVQRAVGANSEFFILLDGDHNGKKAQERYAELFGEVVTSRCITLDSVVNNGTIESLFSDEDKKMIIEKQGLKGSSKVVFQRAVELCVAQKTEISLSSTTAERLELLQTHLSSLFGQI